MARAVALSELSADIGDDAFVRGLIDEVRAHADSLGFRLEGTGYDCLCISATTAMLCKTLAQLKPQLAVIASRGRGEFSLSL